MSSLLWDMPKFPVDDLFRWLLSISLPLLGGCLTFVTSDSSPASIAWRKSLQKSRLTPSARVTAAVWVSLYICMGHSAYLIYTRRPPRPLLPPSLIAYLTQALLNNFYILVLFGLQRVDLAMLMMIPLWSATLITMVLFWDVLPHAGLFMLPVVIWVSFNVYLNIILVLKNPVYSQEQMISGKRKGKQP